MKFATATLATILAAGSAGYGADAQPEPVVVLPKVVITAYPDVEFFTVSWKNKSYLPFAKIKRAWFSRVLAGGPAELAGVKVGDELLVLGGTAVSTMSGFSMKINSLRRREYGTSEEIVFRNAKGETRTVEFVYERPKKKSPESQLTPPPPGKTAP